MAASRDLLAKEEEDASGEVIPSEGNSPACQSFKKALFGWSQILKDSSELPPSLRNEDITSLPQ